MRIYPWLLLAACGVDADPKLTSLPDSVRAAEERMHARFSSVQLIEHGIVTNRLVDVRAGAAVIASLDEPDVLAVWQPYLADVKRAAQDLQSADNVVTAARLAADLAGQCARCHQAIGARITFRDTPKPDAGKRLSATMAGHQWAVGQMWEGLIGPSEQRWTSGADALQRAPLTFVAESGELGIADDVVLIRLMARRATTAGQPERAELFGRLLATCARCHSTIRDLPENKP